VEKLPSGAEPLVIHTPFTAKHPPVMLMPLPAKVEVAVVEATMLPVMESAALGEVEPMPTFTPKLMMSLFAPMVRVRPLPCPLMVEFSSKTRFAGEPTSPMTTSLPAWPMETSSAPAVVSMRKRGLAVVLVAMLLTMVLVAATR